MSLDSRLRRGLLEIGEGFDPGAAVSFGNILRRGERRIRTKRAALVSGAVGIFLVAVSAGAIVDAVRSAWRDYNESSDPARRAASLAVPGPPAGLVDEAGQLWTIVAERDGYALTRVEPRGGGSTKITRFDGGVVDLAAGEGALWVLLDHNGTRLLRIDPASGVVEKSARLGSPRHVAVGAGSLWLARDRAVTRVDPHSLLPSAVIRTEGPIERLEAGAGAVWVDPVSGPVLRIEPGDNAVTQRYSRTNLEALGATSAWLSRPAGAKLKDVIRVDAHTYQGVAWGAVDEDAILAATETGAWVLSSTRPGSYSLGHLDEPGVIFATTIPLRGGDLSSPRVVGDTLFVVNRRDEEIVAIDIGGLR